MNVNQSDGWIKIHRKLVRSDLSQDHNALVVFVNLLTLAHHQDDFTSTRFGGQQRYLKAGQLVISVSELAFECGLTPSQTRYALDRLASSERITNETDHQKTIISICNWAKYQADIEPENKRTTNEQQTSNKRVTNDTHIKRNKEYKKVIGKPITRETELDKPEKPVVTGLDPLELLEHQSSLLTSQDTKSEQPSAEQGEAKHKHYGKATVQELIDLYCQRYQKNPNLYHITPDRVAKLQQRLKSFTLDQIKQAIINASQDAWFGGKASSWYPKFDWFFESDKNLNKTLELEPKGNHNQGNNQRVFDATGL